MVKSGKFLYIFVPTYTTGMATFIGDYICKLDAKGRVLLPAALKRQMTEGIQDRFVIKKDIFENCLILFPIEEWERQNNIIRSSIEFTFILTFFNVQKRIRGLFLVVKFR